MNPSWRKPVGMLAILLLIAVWCVVIISFSEVISGWHWAAQLMFYLVTGIIWITPLKPLLRWMETARWR
ncbi:DUF2842 domain-containing protein [Sphingomonas radiodurans]|uniref:DUF2842 domain-containing protein n=1 Tax=Sphingomonas radiodurans TaxID=2890321 RepID=UPI001E3D1D65|nr:DUF2842 domain-containing protein [Sphingomonas radiodurans]WBH16428.1 DUF2842 domain-containing protein [Sphingomonas radiodurans]